MRNLTIWKDNSNLSPWLGLLDLRKNIDRVFDRVLENVPTEFSNDESKYFPTCEISEDDSRYLLSVDVPGVSKKDIHIEVKGNQLFISGERKIEKTGSRFSERAYGKFFRVVDLPNGVETDKIEAQYQDGVLTIAIAKAESAKRLEIRITDGKNSILGTRIGENKESEMEAKANSRVNAAQPRRN